ncbi:MAG: FecR domain-containing protein [Deltaproteobacteria bacterium]|nr:FecR domain-containing protein [Deltaproteobacteria bacterium]
MNDMIKALKDVEPAWTGAEYDRLFADAKSRVSQRRALRRRLRVAGGALGAVALAVSVLSLVRRPAPTTVAQIETNQMAASSRLLRFPDGSTVELLKPQTTLTPHEVSLTQTHLELASGSARFAVTSQSVPHFRVDVGTVSVEVLGTKFDLERQDARTLVTVQEGLVWVTWPGGGAEVQAGQSGVFPPVTGRPSAAASAPPAARVSSSDWRRLARRQDFRAALNVLEREQPVVRDEPGDLLLAADAARLGGKPAKAVPYLQAVVKRHPADARASAAAFTLGRLYLDALGEPRKAADCFADARRLSPHGPLAEDALFRHAEALARAQAWPQANAALADFERLFPNPRRAEALRALLRNQHRP